MMTSYETGLPKAVHRLRRLSEGCKQAKIAGARTGFEQACPECPFKSRTVPITREFPHLKAHVKHVTHVYCLTCIGGRTRTHPGLELSAQNTKHLTDFE